MDAPGDSVIPKEWQDPRGAETLVIMQAARRYNAWQYRRVAPFLGRRIGEIGSGLGNLSEHLLGGRPDLLVLTDTGEDYRARLRHRFGGYQTVRVEELTLPDEGVGDRFRSLQLDTVVALNVLEHIREDVAALSSIASMLVTGGRGVILVPALPSLYGSLDVELGHIRRYTRQSLAAAMTAAGFTVERILYFNLVGILGWWFNSRVRRVPTIPPGQLRWFEAFVPLLQLEDWLPLPFGQSVIGIGAIRGR